MANKTNKVLIVGGGFGGIKAALELSNNENFNISLLSDQKNFRYYPTLFRAATGGKMSASQIPLSEIFAGKNIELINDTANKLNQEDKKIIGASGKSYSYDVLVLALGVVTNFFGIKGLKEYSYGIKSVEEAGRLRDHIHKLLLDEGKPDQNYVVIGGGPTGVELAGALPAYIHHIMKKHKLKDKKLHIDLVEASAHLVSRLPREYSLAVEKRLRKLGVKLYLKQAVQAEDADSLTVGGHSIKSHTVIWTAGVTNHPFYSDNKFALSEHGKVNVDKQLQAGPDVFVIGDNADTMYSGMAQTALYDAVFVAQNLRRRATGKEMRDYKPKKPVYITPVGGSWAAVLWNKVHLYGRAGWMLRSAADFSGYKDYEPWWRASEHWLAEFESEPLCQICNPK